MSEATSKRSGIEQAAILLLSLGEQEAGEVLKHLSAKDVQRVGAAMSQLSNVTREEAITVLDSFATVVENQTSLGVGADEYVRKVMTNALGADKAGGVLDRILGGRTSKGLEALKWMDARSVAEMMRTEHPQIVSIVLSYLDRDQAGEVLGLLPETQRADVIIRIATLDGVQPSALNELDEVMERQFAGSGKAKTSGLGGLKAAAEILNFIEPSKSTAIMESIAKADEPLSTRIQDLMFVFDDLIDLEDRAMQEILRQVPADKLLLALKAADEQLKEKIYKNMSQRAAQMLKDDLEAKGPVKLSEVEAAQKEILIVVRKAADEGTISLGGGKGGEAYV
jgi:flagellar motor switch protein FliG